LAAPASLPTELPSCPESARIEVHDTRSGMSSEPRKMFSSAAQRCPGHERSARNRSPHGRCIVRVHDRMRCRAGAEEYDGAHATAASGRSHRAGASSLAKSGRNGCSRPCTRSWRDKSHWRARPRITADRNANIEANSTFRCRGYADAAGQRRCVSRITCRVSRADARLRTRVARDETNGPGERADLA
jgi:hypothetical protein